MNRLVSSYVEKAADTVIIKIQIKGNPEVKGKGEKKTAKSYEFRSTEYLYLQLGQETVQLTRSH